MFTLLFIHIRMLHAITIRPYSLSKCRIRLNIFLAHGNSCRLYYRDCKKRWSQEKCPFCLDSFALGSYHEIVAVLDLS